MAKTKVLRRAPVQRLVQPNRHPEAARSAGEKPAGRAIMQPLGGGTYVIPAGGSRPKP